MTPGAPPPFTRRQAWLIATRPRTLPAAIAPVLVGSGIAAGTTWPNLCGPRAEPGDLCAQAMWPVFRWDAFVAALIAALAIQVAANFANDASDAARGADTADRIGPPRMVAAGVISTRAMWTATWLAVAVAGLAGVYLVSIAGWVVALIGVASVVAMLTYVGGPIPYGYRGLGEVMVFVFFGLVATVGSRYVHDDRWAGPEAWWLGGVMGMLAAAILVANNLRDIETDERVGKHTLAVMLGRGRTRRLYAILIYGAFALIAVGSVTTITPPLTGLAVLLAPFAVPLVRTVFTSTEGPRLIRVLAGTARLQLLVGAILGAAASVSDVAG